MSDAPSAATAGAHAGAGNAALIALIRAEIERAGGMIPFARYMELALYAPGLGYYDSARGQPGARGDFVTAPELGPLFARCLARQCAPILTETAGEIIEAGAGSGRLCADLLIELARLGALPTRYRILDASAGLRAAQQETIAALPSALRDRVEWLERLPERIVGVVLANEVLDAMPAEIVRLDDHSGDDAGVWRMGVGVEQDRFVWRTGPLPDALHDTLATLVRDRLSTRDLPRPYVTEINPLAEAWTRTIGERLQRGALLIVDYGFPRDEYYHPARARGTLMCHARQRVHADPLVLPGLQDITAHVDFGAIAEAGRDAGLSLLGYTSQAAFLLALGITDLVTDDQSDARAQLAATTEIKKLTLPHEMGELFKVLALGRGIGTPLAGFRLAPRRL